MWRLREKKIKRQIHINWTSVGNCPCGNSHAMKSSMNRFPRWRRLRSMMARSASALVANVTTASPLGFPSAFVWSWTHSAVTCQSQKNTHTTTSVRTQREQNSVSFCCVKNMTVKKQKQTPPKKKQQQQQQQPNKQKKSLYKLLG